MLQGRLFSYADTHMYRLGANYQQLPINRPRVAVNNYNQDGSGNQGETKGDVNYQPSVEQGSVTDNPVYKATRTPLSGTVQQELITKTDNFEQAGAYYHSLTSQQQDDLIEALGGELQKVKNDSVRQTMLSHFYKADATYGTRLAQRTKDDVNTIKALADKLKD